MEEKIQEYAQWFWKNLTDEPVNIPIICYDPSREILNSVNNGARSYTAGGFIPELGIIRIAVKKDVKRLSKSMKKIIRHEICHFYLWRLGFGYYDNSLDFWELCYIHDAGAYMDLSDEDRIKFEKFVESRK